MLIRRLCVGVVCAVLALALPADRLAAAPGDKQLVYVKGSVGFKGTATAPVTPLFGRQDLGDDAFAVTQAASRALLRLRDSSEIDIGEKTEVQVGAFSPAESGNKNSIVLNNGALHFIIRHPKGGQANYQFTTATSQIAVRGTEGYLISGPNGTQVICVSCAPGDVTITTGAQTLTIVTGQTLTVIGTSSTGALSTVGVTSTLNNVAVAQFSLGTTGGIAGGAAAASTTAIAAGATAAVAATAIVISNANKTTTPTTTTTNPPAPGPLSATFNFPQTAFASFPQPFTFYASQQNATTGLTVTGSPSNLITCCTVTQTSAPPSLSASVTGSLLGPGVSALTLSASGASIPAGITVYGAVTSSTPALNLTATGQTASVTIAQLPLGTALTATKSCVAGADINLQSTSGVSPWTLTATAVSAPSSPSATAACTISITGSGMGVAASLQLPVNISTTTIGVGNQKRKPL